MSAYRPVLELAPPAPPPTPRRGGRRRAAVPGHEEEFYPTPADVVRAFAPVGAELPRGRWFGPTAGAGAIQRALGPLPGVTWELSELQSRNRAALERLASERRDVKRVDCPVDYFARPAPSRPYAVALDNPPFSLAERMLWKLRKEAHVVALLLPIGFLETEDRAAMFERDPADVWIVPWRPNFKGDGGGDQRGVAWFVWPGERRFRHVRKAGAEFQTTLIDGGQR